MKRALLVVSVVFVALYAYAGPRPYANVTVTANATVATLPLTENYLAMQCPGGAVWMRTFTSDEYAAQDGGAQSDGGAFGVRVDFTSATDPLLIVRTSGQVAIGLLGTDAGGTLPCYFSVP